MSIIYTLSGLSKLSKKFVSKTTFWPFFSTLWEVKFSVHRESYRLSDKVGKLTCQREVASDFQTASSKDTFLNFNGRKTVLNSCELLGTP